MENRSLPSLEVDGRAQLLSDVDVVRPTRNFHVGHASIIFAAAAVGLAGVSVLTKHWFVATAASAAPIGIWLLYRRKRKFGQAPLSSLSIESDFRKEPIEIGRGVDRKWLSRFPLRTKGRQIVDVDGERFRLCAGNWYGASDCYHVVAGLDTQNLDVICEGIRGMGFNSVRLPFSAEMLRSSPAIGSIDFVKNPCLKGLSSLEVYDEVVRALGRHKIAVILNNHTTYGQWCGGPDANGLWFDPSSSDYTEANWICDWAVLASRYRKCPHVVGCDLRNEVRFIPQPFLWPIWGSSRFCGFFAVDYEAASIECARHVARQNSDVLVVIERIVWPAGDLRCYANSLLEHFPQKLVLGAHHYSWMGPGRFLHPDVVQVQWLKRLLRFLRIFSMKNYGDMSLDEMRSELVRQWCFLLRDNRCPVWISEFGTGPVKDSYDMVWFENFVNLLGEFDADWAYWPLNAGPKPGGNEDESYGLFKRDWCAAEEQDPRILLLRKHGLLPCPASLADHSPKK